MFKQVIIIRRDLGMSVGKIAAQACHASIGSYKKVKESKIHRWNLNGQRKVVLAVDTEKEIVKLHKRTIEEGVPCFLVEDAGLTELEPGTITALGLGPAEEEKLDAITGHLEAF